MSVILKVSGADVVAVEHERSAPRRLVLPGSSTGRSELLTELRTETKEDGELSIPLTIADLEDWLRCIDAKNPARSTPDHVGHLGLKDTELLRAWKVRWRASYALFCLAHVYQWPRL